MRKVRFSVWMIACTVLAAALTAVLPSLRMSSVPTETPARVRLAQVEYGDIEQLAVARGAVRYEQEYAAIAPVTGIVAEVYVEPGDRVTAGQPLLRLDASAEEAALAAAYSAQAEITAEASAWPDGLPVSFLQDSTMAETQARLAAMTLRAAADGQVVDVTTGQYAGILAGSSAVLLCGGQQEIICDVAACDAADLRKGMRAQASANGCTPCTATVTRIGAVRTDALTGQSVCEVALRPDSDLPLPIGAAVDVSISLYGRENAATLPVTALTEDGCIWVVSDHRCWKTPVAVLMQDEMRCWVNLPIGTAVVDQPGALIDGQRIREVQP